MAEPVVRKAGIKRPPPRSAKELWAEAAAKGLCPTCWQPSVSVVNGRCPACWDEALRLDRQARLDQKALHHSGVYSGEAKDVIAARRYNEYRRMELARESNKYGPQSAVGREIARREQLEREAQRRRFNPDKALAEMVKRWAPAPWLFVADVFKAAPDAWQDLILHAVVNRDLNGNALEQVHNKFALKACKGPGKTCVEAWVIYWFMTCFPESKVLCTSITGENLRDNLWAELAKWRNKSDLMKMLFEWQTERVYLRERPADWFASARTWPKDADQTRQSETLAGLHAQNSLLVLDEAGGIPVGVLSAGLAHHMTQGSEGKETHLTLLCGNPSDPSGALGFACIEDRKNWWVHEITGDPDDPMRAPRIDKAEAQRMIDVWGRKNSWVLINVFGKFPKTAANKLLGPDQVRRAMKRRVAEMAWHRAPRIMGVDVGRSLARDPSVLCRRQGMVVFPFIPWHFEDTMLVAGQVAYEFSRWPADVIFVDMLGNGGGVYDRLRELGYPVIGINSGLPACDRVRFQDQGGKRTEMWWRMHVAVKGVVDDDGDPEAMNDSGLALPDDPELVAELCAPLLKWNSRGLMKLESKEDMLARGVASPNKADSLSFTFAEPVPERTDDIPRSVLEAPGRGRFVSEYDPLADGEL